jgi:hypothetical protein
MFDIFSTVVKEVDNEFWWFAFGKQYKK